MGVRYGSIVDPETGEHIDEPLLLLCLLLIVLQEKMWWNSVAMAGFPSS